jgi:hypothetical protein
MCRDRPIDIILGALFGLVVGVLASIIAIGGV